MSDRAFRFGLVVGGADTAEQWTAAARDAEQSGYDVLLIPDTPNLVSSFPALAMAAAVTSTIRLGNFVLNTPLRTAGSIAWDAASLDRLSGGRFELGLGAGRPDGSQDAQRLGLPWGTPGERVTRLGDTLREARAIWGSAPVNQWSAVNHLAPVQEKLPVMIAGTGKRLLGLAAREADVVAIAAQEESDLAEKLAHVRAQAGDRFDQLELSVNVFLVNQEVPERLARQFGIDPAKAGGNQLLTALNGSVQEICDVLRRRRDEFGISYVTVNAMAKESFRPVLEKLAGE
jgi:probable F420-dependent oxidoreductase